MAVASSFFNQALTVTMSPEPPLERYRSYLRWLARLHAGALLYDLA